MLKPHRKKWLLAAVALLVVAGLVSLTLSGQKEPDVVRVACVGDSITAWTGYPEELQALFESGYQVEKFGVGGATILLNTDRPFLNQLEFEEAKQSNPDIVIILLGTNDARTNIYQFSQNLEADCSALFSAIEGFPSKPKIYVALPPPLFNNTLSLNSENLVQGVIPRVKGVAVKQELPIIDVYKALAGHPEFFPDGVHPDRAGACALATVVFEAIKD